MTQTPDVNPERPTEDNYSLVTSTIIATLVGSVYGVLMRVVFSGATPSRLETMALPFAVLVPMVVGAITVYVAERYARRSVTFYIFGPWLSVTGFVMGTGMVLLEGAICIAMALPLFLLEGSVGGMIMGLIIRWLNKPARTLQSVVLLPLLVAAFGGQHELPDTFHEVVQSRYINAPADVIWAEIINPLDIKPAEFADGFVYKIGVPYPIEARTSAQRVGGVRHTLEQRGVHFDEIITEWLPQQKISWRYHFGPDSFPPGSMDEHVVIGGRYFNLDNTTYILTPEGIGTRLTIVINYRVSTEFNAYAVPVSVLLISNTADALLDFYKGRAERRVM
jgi:hypothetical protein